MKIAITGVTGLRNRGVEALVQPIVAQLREAYGDAEITIYSGSPEYDRGRLAGTGVRVLSEGWVTPAVGRKEKLRRKLGMTAREDVYPGWEELESSDLLIVTGGDVFSSEYGDWSFLRHVVPMRVARRAGLPFVLLAQSIGPFTSASHREGFGEVGRDAAMVSVRERRTFDYLTKELGFEEGKVRLVADPAFLLSAAEGTSGWVRGERGSGRLVVSVSVSQAISEWVGVGGEERVRVWVTLLERMIERWDVDVLLIPHVQEPYADDAIACTNIWRQSGWNGRIRVLAEDMSALEYKGVIRESAMVVAERMHAAIGGFSSGVCTVPIGYSIKAEGITRAVVGPQGVEASELMMPLGELMDLAGAKERLTRVWERREHYRAAIEAGRAGMVREAERNFDLIDGVVGKKR
jgi:colanic acid/amylovoran biosynthesis protein